MIDELKTDYKDDVLATSQQGKRTFNIVGKNGEILFEDVHIEDTSRYLQVGDEYGQEIINEQNSAINQLSKGTGYVYDTYAEYLEAYQGGEIPNGSIVYIKEGSVDGTITAIQVKYNDSNVKLALDTLGNRITQLNNDLTNVENIALDKNNIKVITIVSPQTAGTSSTLALPTGFTHSNCVILSASLVGSSGALFNADAERYKLTIAVNHLDQIEIDADSTSPSSALNQTIKVVVYKYN